MLNPAPTMLEHAHFDPDEFTHEEALAYLFGFTATTAFTTQYLPQAWKNYKRGSGSAPVWPLGAATRMVCDCLVLPHHGFPGMACGGAVAGFSTVGIVMKLWGAAFLCVNAFFLQESLPVLIYGLVSLLQHSFFICQFARYTGHRSYLWWLPLPLLPYTLGIIWPDSIVYTMSVKPLSQIVSHFPQARVAHGRAPNPLDPSCCYVVRMFSPVVRMLPVEDDRRRVAPHPPPQHH